MARTSSGFGSKLLILILLILVAYNFWQIRILNHEVGQLKVKLAAVAVNSRAGQVQVAKTTLLLNQASEHFAKAKQLLGEGKKDLADKEVEKGLQLLRQAGVSASEPIRGKLDGFRRSTGDWMQKIERLRKAWDNESKQL